MTTFKTNPFPASVSRAAKTAGSAPLPPIRSTTFAASSPTATPPAARPSGSSGARLSVADIAATVSNGPLPFRLTAYDGSSTGRDDAPIGLHVANQRALTYVLTAPGDLGLARAYVAGDLQFKGIPEADPYELLRTMADGLHLRRPTAAEVRDIVA